MVFVIMKTHWLAKMMAIPVRGNIVTPKRAVNGNF
jgi:hypothetical protein